MTNTNFLTNIITEKKKKIEVKKQRLPLEKIKEQLPLLDEPRNFKAALKRSNGINLIAEIKKASPSAGTIVPHFSAEEIAREYTKSGAKAISVLTEEKYFQGDLFHLLEAHKSSPLPILRKDFIVDEYEIYESRYFTADAVLLIAEILSLEQINRFLDIMQKLKMAALVEVHTKENLEKVLASTTAGIIGINNRDLNTFEVDFNICLQLKNKIPQGKIIVAESGIKTREDILKLTAAGFNAVLIGQSLLETKSIAGKIKELFF